MRKLIQAIFYFPSLTRFKIIVLIGLTIGAAFFELFGVAMVFPIIDFIEKGRDFSLLAAQSRMWHIINRVFDILWLPKNLIMLMAICFCLLLSRQIFNYLKTTYNLWITESIFADIRSIGFKRFISADMPFFDSHGVGQLINSLIMDGVRAGAGIFSFFNLLSASIIILFYFSYLFWLHPKMTLLALIMMGGAGILLRSRFKKSKEIGINVSKYNEKLSASIVERLNGIRLIKTSTTEQVEIGFIKNLSEMIKLNTFSIGKIKAKMELVIDPIVFFFVLIVIYVSVEIYRMTLSQIIIFIFVLYRINPYTKDIFNSRQALAGFSGSLYKVKNLLEEAQKADVIKGGTELFAGIRKSIQFQDVSFSYDSVGPCILQDINIILPAGKMMALVGRSGAGKSTLVDLIPRLRIQNQGKILFDDRPIECFDLKSLRKAIAFVSQEGFLFNDTVENNIKYCQPHASEEDFRDAAKAAYADHFIDELPQKYQTIVGEKGLKLSGGQKQRIILARALLQKASIIILDEPTSALDSESELSIKNAIEKLRAARNITLIIIAHRLSTIRSADQIIVIDKGKIIETGTHGQLIHEDRWYADMVKMQNI